MKVINKTYIDNSRFMEFIDEMATQITEMNFGQETFEEKSIYIDGEDKNHYELQFTNEAQEYYNQMYDEYEMIANKIMGVYSDNHKK